MKKRQAQHKSFAAKAKTDGDEGSVKIAFAKLDTVDHDGDITRPGAFPDRTVAMHVQHDGHSNLPVGKGRISEEDGWAVFDGQFNLDIQAGRDAYASVKFQDDIQEWSYGYFVEEAAPGDGKSYLRELKKLDVYEVSAVTIGAGVETRTLALKQRGETINLIEHLAENGDPHAEVYLEMVNAEAAESEGLKFVDACQSEAKRLSGLIERATEIRKLRSEKGRELGDAAVVALKDARDSLSSLLDDIDDAHEQPDDVVEPNPIAELARFERTRAQLAGHI